VNFVVTRFVGKIAFQEAFQAQYDLYLEICMQCGSVLLTLLPNKSKEMFIA
jgi:hypothetical protein